MREPGAEWYRSSGIYAGEDEGVLDARHAAFFGHVAPGRLLDAGCGRGTFLRAARERGFEVRGIEQQTDLVTQARGEGLDVLAGTIPDSLSALAEFDAVTVFDVLEHLADPLGALEALLAALRPGGSLVLSVPRADRHPPVFDPVVDAPPHHLTLWCPAALRIILERAGAAEIQVIALPLTARDLFLHHLWRRHGRGALTQDRRDGLTRRWLRLRVALLRGFSRARGHTLVAIARRPS